MCFGRLYRSAAVKAIFGANLVAAAVVLIRVYGWLQPAELLVYDALRAAFAGNLVSDRVVLVLATEQDILAGDDEQGRRWGWPARDGALAGLLDRLASLNPRAIGVDIYRDVPEPPGTAE